MLKRLKQNMELIKYICVGGGAVLIDYLAYGFLRQQLVIEPSISKGTSYILGALFAFALNKIWTFESKQTVNKELMKFATLYGATFVTNVFINYSLLTLTNNILLAFLFATGTSTLLNYLGQKFWVFKREVL